MASLRDIRRRIQAVKNTRQITRAMKLVAGAKLRRATRAAVAARPYQRALQRVLQRVAAASGDVEHPLLAVPDNDTDVTVIVITADGGLCGSFNSQIQRAAHERIDALVAEGKTIHLHVYGKKGVQYFKKRGFELAKEHIGLAPATLGVLADDLMHELVRAFEAGETGAVYLAYNEFRSVVSQKPVFERILPMQIEADSSAEGAAAEYIYEPKGDEILGQLLPLALRGRIFQAFLESEAGKQAAQMTAMDSATRNASELIDTLTLQYNRARQAAITTELTEIVTGAEAL